jgi:hypothetical protein
VVGGAGGADVSLGFVAPAVVVVTVPGVVIVSDVSAAVLEVAPATSAAAAIAAHNVFVRIVMSLLLRV